MALLGPKKDGGPNTEFFQSPESMQGFETVRQWLQKNCKKVSVLGGLAAILHKCIYVHNIHRNTRHIRKNEEKKQLHSIPAILKTKRFIRLKSC